MRPDGDKFQRRQAMAFALPALAEILVVEGLDFPITDRQSRSTSSRWDSSELDDAVDPEWTTPLR
jgi:hypothetical protein